MTVYRTSCVINYDYHELIIGWGTLETWNWNSPVVIHADTWPVTQWPSLTVTESNRTSRHCLQEEYVNVTLTVTTSFVNDFLPKYLTVSFVFLQNTQKKETENLKWKKIKLKMHMKINIYWQRHFSLSIFSFGNNQVRLQISDILSYGVKDLERNRACWLCKVNF